MTDLFCPQSIVWGDVATGVAATATFAAVVVALVSSGRANKLAREIHEREQRASEQTEQRLRACLSVAFDQELYLMEGQIDFVISKLDEATRNQRLPEAQMVMRDLSPINGLELLERFAPDLVVFPPQISALLLNILGTHLAIKQAPMPQLSSDENFHLGVQGFRETLANQRQTGSTPFPRTVGLRV